MSSDTVELPADPRIKQLANDIVTEDNEECVPLLLDFYEFVATLNDDSPATRKDLVVDDPESVVGAGIWRNLLDSLEHQGVVDKNPGNTTTYSLDIETEE